MLADVRAGATGGPGCSPATATTSSIAWPDVHVSPLGDRDLLVDGEIIGLNADGLPDFGVLQERMHVRSATTAARLADRIPATYMVFDLLRLDGEDLTDRPLSERRALPRGTGPRRHVAGARVVRRRRDALRRHPAAGARGRGEQAAVVALQVRRPQPPLASSSPHRHRFSYVVAGWRPQEGTSDRLAALLVGEPTPDGLMYRGRVGSGIGGAASRLLDRAARRAGRDDSPFADEVPRVDATRHPLGRAARRRRRRHPQPHAEQAAAPAVVPGRPQRPGARRTCRHEPSDPQVRRRGAAP